MTTQPTPRPGPFARMSETFRPIFQQIAIWTRPLTNLIDDVVNRLFRMRYVGGLIRLALVIGFGLVGWLLLAINIHPYAHWRHLLPTLLPGMNPYIFVLSFFWTILRNTLLAWDVLTYVILGLLPFFAAIEFAAVYLVIFTNLMISKLPDDLSGRRPSPFQIMIFYTLKTERCGPKTAGCLCSALAGQGMFRLGLKTPACLNAWMGLLILLGQPHRAF